MSDILLQQRSRAGQLAAQGRLIEALAEFRQLEQQERREEAAAGYEGLAMAWAHGSQLLRAIVACKALLALEPDNTRVPSAIAALYARPGEPESQPPAPSERVPDWGGSVSVPIFTSLGREDFVALLRAIEVRTYPAGQSVVREGEPATSMFFLVEGRTDFLRKQEGGVKQAVAAMGEGGVFGELSLVSEGPRLATVVASVPSVLLELLRERVGELASRHPRVEAVVQAFCRERVVDSLMRTHPMFSHLPYEQKRAVAREFQLQQVEAGRTLLTAGQRGEAIYLLLRGQCTPFHVHPDGRETPYPELREGDLFGEISLLLDKPATAMVRTDMPCVVLRLDRAACERHILSQPGIRDALMRMGNERLSRTAQMLADHC